MLRNAISSDRVYMPNIDDLIIQSIHGSTTGGGKVWGLWVNFKYIPTSIAVGAVPPNVGAGQTRVTNGDNVLWAYVNMPVNSIATSWSTKE
jgi:hypothetical protein